MSYDFTTNVNFTWVRVNARPPVAGKPSLLIPQGYLVIYCFVASFVDFLILYSSYFYLFFNDF